MTRTEHLLTIAAEECAEIAQRVSKALRFGLQEIQPGQERTNAERVMEEVIDLQAVLELLYKEKVLPEYADSSALAMMQTKKDKIKNYLAYSKQCGTLTKDKIPS